MAYIVNKFSGAQLVVLEDGTIDTSTSLGLVGRNYVGYGETQNENFVFLLENFANEAPPSRPLQGQIWFNTTTNITYAYDGTAWNPIGAAVLSATAPADANAGALWLDTTANQLKIYTGSAWTFIGPEAVAGFGVTRARATSLDDSVGDPRPVIILETNGTALAICTSQAFTINPSNAVAGFENNLVAGINLSTTAKIKGDITGNAASADRLTTARTINGVPFDGQQNVTIKSSTTNKLVRGTYILGSDFDGSTEVTWSVDASPSNVIGKLVARNSEGGFSAGTISADLVGTVFGNVNINSGTSVFNVVQANTFVGATLTGNANSATQLATARQINGVNFNGTSNITVTAEAATLTGDTLNSTVTQSSLQQLGTLVDLNVTNNGVYIGSSGQLRMFVDSGRPTIRSSTGILNFDIGPSGPDVSFVDAATALSLGGLSAPSILGDNTTNLGIVGYKFNKVYANNFIGNADTATLATSSNNLTGGGAGAIPFQTAAGTTSMLGLGTAGYVLTAQAGSIAWAQVSREPLRKGSFLTLVNTSTSGAVASYDGIVDATIAVDATSANTASKVVARDASGNFSAGTITATLSGAASSNVLKSGDTMSGFLTLHSNPSTNLHAATKQYVDSAVSGAQYYDTFSTGSQSPLPTQFPAQTIRGFSAYSSTDFPGAYYGGVTVTGPSGVYSGQIAFNWNSEEAAPTGLYFRVNDDTSNTSAWSAWRQLATTAQITNYTIISGASYSIAGFTNQVGSFNDGANYFDVYPPAGKTMANLVAFIPSIHVVHYAGGVDGNDSIRCTYSYLSNRIRVWVQNTEQRSTPAANYLVIWS